VTDSRIAVTATPELSRGHLAQKLGSVKQSVAQSVMEECFLLHPDWLECYGETGRQHCMKDVGFHIDFLAGSIEAGSPDVFADYVQWSARMLGSRGISEHSLYENLEQLQRQLSQVLLPEERAVVTTFVAAGMKVLHCRPVSNTVDVRDDQLARIRQMFLTAILSGNRQAALDVIDGALNDGHSHINMYIEVFAESLHRVGELWEMNQVSIAREHMATAITQHGIAMMYPRMEPPQVKRGSMVVTGVCGEMHQVGANLVADAMEAQGWDVRFLGSDVPPSAVLEVLVESKAQVLCISTTIVANLPAVADLLRTVRGKLQDNAPRIVLGGMAYQTARQFFLPEQNVEIITDLRQAISLLCP
jgi:MerR family transcriptional regulator, light-induced transcriptional regulator